MLRRRSIRFRLTVWYAVTLFAGLSIFSGLIWLALRHQLIREIERDLRGRTDRFESFFKAESLAEPKEDLKGELIEFCQALPPAGYIKLTGHNGFTFQYPATLPLPAVEYKKLRRQFDSLGETFDIEAAEPAADVEHTLDLLRLLLLALIPLVTTLACAGGAWLSGRALKPVEDITNGALALSVENLSERLPIPHTGDELERLSLVLNSMLARIENTVQALSRFAADISHELRTPLAVIHTTAELAGRRERTPAAYRDALREIETEAAHMTRLVEELLALARTGTQAVEMPQAALDLRDLVDEVCGELRSLAEARSVEIVTITSETAVVSGNRAALRRLFTALIENAVKFSHAGSAVTVGIRSISNEAQVSIEDTGAGISAEQLPHIFQRFYRGGSAQAGHGLGLHLADIIARSHGARIEVVSEVNGGSTFTVVIPVRPARLESERLSKSSGTAATIA